jgi:hypothetical protein
LCKANGIANAKHTDDLRKAHIGAVNGTRHGPPRQIPVCHKVLGGRSFASRSPSCQDKTKDAEQKNSQVKTLKQSDHRSIVEEEITVLGSSALQLIQFYLRQMREDPLGKMLCLIHQGIAREDKCSDTQIHVLV